MGFLTGNGISQVDTEVTFPGLGNHTAPVDFDPNPDDLWYDINTY